VDQLQLFTKIICARMCDQTIFRASDTGVKEHCSLFHPPNGGVSDYVRRCGVKPRKRIKNAAVVVNKELHNPHYGSVGGATIACLVRLTTLGHFQPRERVDKTQLSKAIAHDPYPDARRKIPV